MGLGGYRSLLSDSIAVAHMTIAVMGPPGSLSASGLAQALGPSLRLLQQMSKGLSMAPSLPREPDDPYMAMEGTVNTASPSES